MWHKIQNRIPLIISVLGVFYIISPLFYYLHAYFYYAQAACGLFDVVAVFNSVGGHYMPQLLAVIVVTPIVGVGLVLKRKWGLYLFFVYGILLIGQSLLNYLLYPASFSMGKIALNAVFVVILLLFVRIDLRAPFYRVDWAVREKRHKHKIAVSYRIPDMDGQTHEAYTVDISEGGYFVAADQLPDLGEKVVTILDPSGASVQLRGVVSWLSQGSRRAPRGFGLMFDHQGENVYQQIANLIEKA